MPRYLQVCGDSRIVPNLESLVERHKSLVIGTVMECAECDTVAGFVSAVRMDRWQDMGGVQELELHAAHRTAVPVGRQDTIAKIQVSERPRRCDNGKLPRCRDFALDFRFTYAGRVLGNLIQHIDLGRYSAAGMKRLEVLDVGAEKIGPERNGQLAVVTIMQCKSGDWAALSAASST